MNVPRYTPAQIRALEWLPADGSEREGRGLLAVTLRSLVADGYVAFRSFGLRGYWRARLTPAGIAARAELAKKGVIE